MAHYLHQCWLIINVLYGIDLRAISQEMLMNLIRNMCSETTLLNLLPHLPGADESIYSLWPSDVIWRHRTGSTKAQVMACCLMAPSHYLNQCWFLISDVSWHSSWNNFSVSTQAITLSNNFENDILKITATSPRGPLSQATKISPFSPAGFFPSRI